MEVRKRVLDESEVDFVTTFDRWWNVVPFLSSSQKPFCTANPSRRVKSMQTYKTKERTRNYHIDIRRAAEKNNTEKAPVEEFTAKSQEFIHI
jgi:hypothetical protein